MLENIFMGPWIFPVMGISLALTIVVEAGAAFLWNIRNPWDLALTGAVNLLTNPAVVAAYYLTAGIVRIWGGSEWLWILIPVKVLFEASAICVEAVCYKAAGRDIPCPWLFSLIANMASYFIGAGLQWML